jgi:hypothetical protein
LKNYDIVAYTFNADIYCPNCIVGAYNGNSDEYDAETMLRATTLNVDPNSAVPGPCL